MRGITSRTLGVVACALTCALLPAAASGAHHAPSRYLLRHPKRQHCKAHYKKQKLTVMVRVHGHKRKVRRTFCVRVHKSGLGVLTAEPLIPWRPAPGGGVLGYTSEQSGEPGGPPRQPRPKPEHKPPTCTTTFTGSQGNSWAAPGNWTAGVPNGFSAFGCIPPTYPGTVVFGAESPSEVGGLSAENPGGLTLQGGSLALLNSAQPSYIVNVTPGATHVTLAEGVVLQLAGLHSATGGDDWSGPGTIELLPESVLRTGVCERWEEPNEAFCVNGTPTPGSNGLHIRNYGKVYGAGITLCRNGAAEPGLLENESNLLLHRSAGFGGGGECSDSGPVVNRPGARLELAQNDGNGCNVRIHMASLINEGKIKLSSCFKPETQEIQRPKLEIEDSLSEAGELYTAGIVQVGGDYTPSPASNLRISIRQVFPRGAPETNFGTLRVAGNAVLGGELNVETDTFEKYPPSPGVTFQILSVSGSLSGEYRLGNHCVPEEPGIGYNVLYQRGSKGTVTLKVGPVAGC